MLVLSSIQREDTTVAFISDRRLYLTADRNAVVEEGDPAAAYLLVGVGGEVSTAVANRYGLADQSTPKAKEPEPEGKEPADAPEQKAVAPAANKAVQPKADK